MDNLFDPNDFKDKNLTKIVNNLNKFVAKNKIDKIRGVIPELEELSKNQDLRVQVLYILSVIAENFISCISKDNINSVLDYLKSENEKLKLNTIIIIGFYLIEHLKKEKKLVNQFLGQLRDDNKDVVENIVFFFKKFIEIEPSVVQSRIDLVLILLKRDYPIEFIVELLDVVDCFKINFLSNAIKIRDALKEIIAYYDDETLIKNSIKILSRFIPELKTIELTKGFKGKILTAIDDKILTKRYDISARKGDVNKRISEFKDKLKRTIKSEDIFYCYIKDENILFFIEFEREKIINFLEKRKISLKELQSVFREAIESKSQIKSLIQNLIQFKLVKGYLSEFYFYPFNFVKQDIRSQIKDSGVVSLNEYEFLEPQFISTILEDIQSEINKPLLFSKSAKRVYSLKRIIEEITQSASKENSIDLKRYRDLFKDEHFLEIIKNLPKGYLTDYHIRTTWLTNVGKTRIMNEFNNSKKIGYFDKKKISDKLKIPEILMDAFIYTIFDSQLGFWDKFQNIFYYSKYVQDQIGKIKNLANEEIKKQKVAELARKLDVDKDQIQLKIENKFKEVGEEIKAKDEISITSYLDKTAMGYNAFIEFVNNLDLNYFKKGDMLYLSEKKIDEIQKEIREEIKKLSKSKSKIFLKNFNVKISVVKEIIEDLQNSESINGIFYEENGELVFYTEKGIYDKIMEAAEIIFMDQLFPGKELTNEELMLIEDQIQEMIKRKELIGKYDETTRTFSSFEIQFSMNYNNAIEQYAGQIEYFITIFERAFNTIKEILIKTDDIIRPNEINAIQNSIDEINKSYIRWRNQLNQMNYRQTNYFLKQQGINSMKDYEILPDEKKKAINLFKEDPHVKESEEVFNAWIKKLNELELNYGKIIFLQKQILMKKRSAKILKELNELYKSLDLK